MPNMCRVGLLLSRYKSGKLPKIFKILPTLPNWEILLSITHPENWTPNAIYAGTRIFVASKPAITQTFLAEVLLPRVREDIYENRKLNVHLYNSLKKALFKPASFFKGFLFPMLISGTCTQREAIIVASVITRISVPRDHSAAALFRLCDIAAEQMSSNAESAGATNICIKALLEKKYALPYRVIDALVFHFLRFKSIDPSSSGGMGDMDEVTGHGGSRALAEARLPVIWHQCLLAFAQHYRDWITEDQREALLDLLLDRGHKAIGPEIRRELLAGRGRGVPMAEGKIAEGEDDTMVVDE
jgi:essential nuclear protein 1